MEHLPGGNELVSSTTLASSAPIGLLLSQDLIFTSKIKGTAAELGYTMMVAGTESHAKLIIESYRPAVVLIDLSALVLVTATALMAYQKMTGPDVWFVAFGSHVDVKVLAAAKAAGCHVVLPRSRFAAELPELMRHYFSQAATRDD